MQPVTIFVLYKILKKILDKVLFRMYIFSMKMPKKIKKEVPILITKTNTRVDIPKIFIELLGIEAGDRFLWEYTPGTQEFVGKMTIKQEGKK